MFQYANLSGVARSTLKTGLIFGWRPLEGSSRSGCGHPAPLHAVRDLDQLASCGVGIGEGAVGDELQFVSHLHGRVADATIAGQFMIASS